MTKRWQQWVVGERAVETALLVVVLMSLPFCVTGLFTDDHMQRSLLETDAPAIGDRWHLFTFAGGGAEKMRPLIENGPYPWWTSHSLHFSFFRPLTVLVTNLEHALIGSFAPLMHLHSIAWYLLLVALVARLFRRVFPSALVVAGLSMLLFAVDDSHALVVGWVANRNAVIAAAFAVLSLLAHLRWREGGSKWGLFLSLVAAALGLLGGEVAVGGLVYIAAWELTCGPGSWKDRVRSLIPMACLGIGYVLLYRWTGSGARGSGIYADPVAEPAKFFAQAPSHALVLLAAQYLSIPADLWMAVEPLRPVLAVMGVGAVALLAGLVRALWPVFDAASRQALVWLGLGAVVSLLPVLATFPSNRLLLMPSLGSSGVVALVLVTGWASRARWVRWSVRALAFGTALSTVVLWPATMAAVGLGSATQRKNAVETSVSDQALAGHVLVFQAPDPGAATYAGVIRRLEGKPAAKSWVTLSFAPYPLRLVRVAPATLEVEVVGGRMLGTVMERLFRSDQEPVVLGMKVRLDGVELEVTEAVGGRVGRLRLQFDAPPETGPLTIVTYQGDILVPLVLPAVGEEKTLSKPSGLLSQ